MVEREHLAQAWRELERAGRWAAEAGDEVGSADVQQRLAEDWRAAPAA